MKASWNKQVTGQGRIEGQACSYPCSVTWAHEGSWVSAGRGWGGVCTMGRVTRGLPPLGTKALTWQVLGAVLNGLRRSPKGHLSVGWLPGPPPWSLVLPHCAL